MVQFPQIGEPPKKAVEDAPEKLNLYSLGDLEGRIGFSRQTMRDVVSSAPSYYDPFEQLKPARPFARKKQKQRPRLIDRPTGLLRKIQDRIYYRLLRDLSMPQYICGGVKGRSVLVNVNLHNGANLIVTVDIQSWFPSITARHIYRVWRKILNCSRPVAKLLTRLTTLENRLPQGAPTSTALANLVLYSIDGPIRAAAALRGVSFS
jgi:RNA-directed DNA polymerase